MVSPSGETRCGNTVLRWGSRTYVMGVINVTPDSFSGDGLGDNVQAAVAQARSFAEAGADIIDVGGESTRPPSVYPGAKSVSLEEEISRVLPVIEALREEISLPISIDTYRAEVALMALGAGAVMINDVWALTKDPELGPLAAASGVPVILMHNQTGTQYNDLVPDVTGALKERVAQALACGIVWENIIVDPGIGFGKTWEHSLEIINRLEELKAIGRPILLGASRKSFIGRVLDLPVEERLEGTAAAVALGIARGADIVRVHDVKEMVRVSRMSDAIIRGVVTPIPAPR